MAQTWTEKHNPNWASKASRFAIRVKLTPTARELWTWLVGEIGEGKHETIDLRDFQKLVAKERGKPHDFRVIQTAIARLIEAGIIRGQRKFTNFVWRWTLRPINRLLYPILPKPKISQSRSQIPNLQPSNGSNACHQVQAVAAELIKILPEQLTSELEKNLSLLEEAGIYFDSTDVPQILSWQDPENIKKAIALFHKRGGHSRISNAEGWMRRCLEREWYIPRQSVSFAEALIQIAMHLGVSDG